MVFTISQVTKKQMLNAGLQKQTRKPIRIWKIYVKLPEYQKSETLSTIRRGFPFFLSSGVTKINAKLQTTKITSIATYKKKLCSAKTSKTDFSKHMQHA